MKFNQTSAVALSTLALAACATVETPPEQTFEISEADQAAVNAKKYEILGISPETANDFELSDAALATAVRGPGGAPVGPLAYASPGDAVKAGDMAAFVAAMKLSIERNDSNVPFASAISSIDAAAAEDYERARELADVAAESAELSLLGGFLKAWYLALEGDFDAAVDAELEVGSRLPGLTGDLSLAAMLEAAGLEICDTNTPTEFAAAATVSIMKLVLKVVERDFDELCFENRFVTGLFGFLIAHNLTRRTNADLGVVLGIAGLDLFSHEEIEQIYKLGSSYRRLRQHRNMHLALKDIIDSFLSHPDEETLSDLAGVYQLCLQQDG